MKDVNYTVEEFIKDEYFHKWLIDPDPACDEFWLKWMSGDSDRIRTIEEAKEILLSIGFKEEKMPKDDKDSIWGNIEGSIVDTEKKNRALWYPIAAAVSVVVAASFILMSLIVQSPSWNGFNNEVVYIEKVIPIGQKSIVRLADGTQVKLNAGSKMRYPQEFTDSQREVFLEGEAFFEVARDETRPFTVKSGDIETTVLGTSFNIRAYPEQDNIDVAVITGKVAVKNTSFEASGKKLESVTYLTPNDRATYNKNEKTVEKSTFIATDVISWKDNIIYFKDADFVKIRQVLEKWYGVEFVLEKEVKIEKDFSATFDNKPLSAVLEGLSFSLDFEYDIEGAVVTIK